MGHLLPHDAADDTAWLGWGAVRVLSWLWQQFRDLKTSHGPALQPPSNELHQRKEEVRGEGGCPWGAVAQKSLLIAHLTSEGNTFERGVWLGI